MKIGKIRLKLLSFVLLRYGLILFFTVFCSNLPYYLVIASSCGATTHSQPSLILADSLCLQLVMSHSSFRYTTTSPNLSSI